MGPVIGATCCQLPAALTLPHAHAPLVWSLRRPSPRTALCNAAPTLLSRCTHCCAAPCCAAGQGAYATVRLLEDWHTGKLFACKTISKARLLCKEDIEDVEREVRRGIGGPPHAGRRQLAQTASRPRSSVTACQRSSVASAGVALPGE